MDGSLYYMDGSLPVPLSPSGWGRSGGDRFESRPPGGVGHEGHLVRYMRGLGVLGKLAQSVEAHETHSTDEGGA